MINNVRNSIRKNGYFFWLSITIQSAAVLVSSYLLQWIDFTNVYFYLGIVLFVMSFLLKERISVYENIGAIVFSLFSVFGNVEAWDHFCRLYPGTYESALYLVLCITGCFLFFRTTIHLCYKVIDRISAVKKQNKKRIRSSAFITLLAGIGFLCYLPYFLAYYPGIATADSYWQFRQAVGILPMNNWLSIFVNFGTTDHEIR